MTARRPKRQPKRQPDIIQDQPIIIRKRWEFTPEQQDQAKHKWNELPLGEGAWVTFPGKGCTAVEQVGKRTIAQATPEEALAFLQEVSSGGNIVLLAKLGHFWTQEWSADEKNRWILAVYEKAGVPPEGSPTKSVCAAAPRT
jgi:hypothetical protein